MIKKLVFSLLFFISFFPVFNFIARAADGFDVDSIVNYNVDDTGKTLVTHDITLQNQFSTLYATTYTLTLENINAANIKVFDGSGKPLQSEVVNKNQRTDVKVTFSDAVVGQGAKRHFRISYENSNFAVRTGEVWEVSIPKLSDDKAFRSYEVDLQVPDSFGQEAYISPQPETRDEASGRKKYSFSKSNMSQTGVTAGFGQFQVFSFNLSYHLVNPLAVNSQTEVALPPDTAFQKVYFSKVVPKPFSVRVDPDGNYIATYKLFPRQRIDVNAEGSVQIFAGFRPFPQATTQGIADNLAPTNYWQSTDPQIKMLAESLKTPQAIYNFVSTKLKYDFERVQPNVARLGAIGALKSPTQAICMEFTDLFIAISRAAGIPAREINGYAYTENKELQPLSLVADVLHAWPEYYDRNKGVWIPVDPTWGSTSGVDYFNKLDLRHFAFVIHGKSDKEPYPPGSYKLGPNPQKDVFVSFGQLPVQRNSIPQLTINTDRNIPFFDTLYSYKVYNPGPETIYAFYPAVYFDNTMHSRNLVEMLPPYGTYTSQIKIPYSLLANDIPDNIKLVVNESQTNLSTNKSQVVINTLIVLFALFIFIVILVLSKLGIINFDPIIVKITKLYAKFTGGTSKNRNNF